MQTTENECRVSRVIRHMPMSLHAAHRNTKQEKKRGLGIVEGRSELYLTEFCLVQVTDIYLM